MPSIPVDDVEIIEVIVAGAQGPAGNWTNTEPFRMRETSISPVAGVLTIDLSQLNTQLVLLNGNVTSIVFSGWPAAGITQRQTIYFKQDGTGGWTVAAGAWTAANVKFPDAIKPVITVAPNAVDCCVFDSFDGGVTIYGNIVGQAYG